MRLRVALLLVAALLSGCASHPAENGASAQTPSTTSPATTTPPPASNGTGTAAFVLAGPELRFVNGTPTSSFHEDDVAVAHYELSLTAGASSDGTAFASYIVNGKVADIQTVHLNPGETKRFDPTISLENLTTVRVQVKVGEAQGEANASIVRWPRANQAFALGAASVTLTYWSNATDKVHAELSAWTPADGNVTALRAALLCRDATGQPAAQPDAQDVALSPGAAASAALDFAPCGAPYGLALSAMDAAGQHEGRVLFVP